MRVKDKVAIVTGGASGIGKEIVRLFQQEGATVIAADINEVALKEVAKWDLVHAKVLDVSSEESWSALASTVEDEFGRIDILVNNAGISSEKPLEEISINDWDIMMRINSFGPFAGIKHVAPIMEKQKTGSIVNISSYTAQIGLGLNAYSASKGAVRALSKAAATHYGRQGVRVNAIFPGVIETPMTQALQSSSQMLNQLIQATPLGRLGTPEDIANTVLFLSSDESSYITGAEIVIDGGFSAQ
ncbi:SDR family oxidoreductase [Alkalihalophilus marmarensis]|jgi:NAD(P)-dependent dehydrogenase (short-subunit alcohol dehydrogenase family)|uniref:Tungsten formylmethanofuran dehydrogenase subunit C n=1 Tax=Alkalihalophilus marmarensis DSM 21297 TaxID=1188261 RepID=U6ST23_9BACI|nr:SDR family oxidoreductase [Alkalihalophilus marmarensis]ERN53801.1 tungsten formylmethanofuran dehydrogenase subunit C [Alkalihalophilus marmarensis DSM 21297]MCM3490667.1 SDR family oxidoreductase [Alkalihalophilus marmarensis]